MKTKPNPHQKEEYIPNPTKKRRTTHKFSWFVAAKNNPEKRTTTKTRKKEN